MKRSFLCSGLFTVCTLNSAFRRSAGSAHVQRAGRMSALIPTPDVLLTSLLARCVHLFRLQPWDLRYLLIEPTVWLVTYQSTISWPKLEIFVPHYFPRIVILRSCFANLQLNMKSFKFLRYTSVSVFFTLRILHNEDDLLRRCVSCLALIYIFNTTFRFWVVNELFCCFRILHTFETTFKRVIRYMPSFQLLVFWVVKELFCSFKIQHILRPHSRDWLEIVCIDIKRLYSAWGVVPEQPRQCYNSQLTHAGFSSWKFNVQENTLMHNLFMSFRRQAVWELVKK